MIKASIRIYCVALKMHVESIHLDRAGIYEYRDETFKHDSFLVVLLLLRSHFEPFVCISSSILSLPSFINSPHGMRMCCSLSIDSFCDFYSHFLCVQKANHLPMCHVLAPFTLGLCRTVFVLFFLCFSSQHTTLFLQVLVWCTKCIHDLH